MSKRMVRRASALDESKITVVGVQMSLGHVLPDAARHKLAQVIHRRGARLPNARIEISRPGHRGIICKIQVPDGGGALHTVTSQEKTTEQALSRSLSAIDARLGSTRRGPRQGKAHREAYRHDMIHGGRTRHPPPGGAMHA